jgi:cytochrome c-type biogenesis protein CcmH
MALAVMAAILAASPVFAVQPDEILKDAGLESRARALSAELRCLVCQNQSIDDSDAPLAKDLRVLVRERLQAGDTDQAVLDYIVARYGDFVLLKPPVNSHTLLLWIAPLFVLAGAVLIARRSLNGPVLAPASTAGLSASEEAELKRILADAPDSSGPRGT